MNNIKNINLSFIPSVILVGAISIVLTFSLWRIQIQNENKLLQNEVQQTASYLADSIIAEFRRNTDFIQEISN